MYDLGIFDRIDCLCLDKRRNDWARLDNEFAEHDGKINRFIVGKGEILPKEMYNFIDPPTSPQWMNTHNAYCCYLSHRKMLENAQKDSLKNVLFVEDDATLTENFGEIFDKALNQIKEAGIKWDTLHYGVNLKWAHAVQVAPNLLKLNHGAYCFHTIALNQEHNDIFQHLLDLPPQNVFDWLHSVYTQPKYNCYAIWPNISFQRAGFSSLNGKVEDYSEWLNAKGNNVII